MCNTVTSLKICVQHHLQNTTQNSTPQRHCHLNLCLQPYFDFCILYLFSSSASYLLTLLLCWPIHDYTQSSSHFRASYHPALHWVFLLLLLLCVILLPYVKLTFPASSPRLSRKQTAQNQALLWTRLFCGSYMWASRRDAGFRLSLNLWLLPLLFVSHQHHL